MIARFTSIALCLALAGLALAQTSRARESDQDTGQGPASRPGQEPRIPNSFYSDTVDAQTHENMQGVWRIEKMEWRDERWGGRDLAGFALIGEGHVSIELHLRVFLATGEELLLQTGIYQYRFNEIGEMEMSALVGATNLNGGGITPARPGEISRFRIRLADDVLVLSRPGSTLTLRRTAQPPPPFAAEKKRALELEKKDPD